ncbi:MAG: hypothetical protein U0271_47575 [Polyangiaceae bacterium]
MATLLEEQGPIDNAIVTALVSAAPSAWRAIRLTAERVVRDEGGETLKLAIDNPDGARGQPPLPDALMVNVRRLSMLLTRHGTPFTKIVYEAREGENDEWDYKASYAYETPASEPKE